MASVFSNLYEIFQGEAGGAPVGIANQHVQESVSTMRFIVSVAWSISPFGDFFGYLQRGVNDGPPHLIYNLATPTWASSGSSSAAEASSTATSIGRSPSPCR